ncbi:MAG: hypothetical protein UX49_C0046G0002 [Candidatus Wolfebacteria bacterium GW2011_GWC2_46_275]|nr:MAG: hypothetical protein UX49_C0046G0002 [Candidatus Wolfebacteria bacterium GW2011_GWC2_46_275]KKU65989.1 MAG: hypothetical protein UX90_C0001G0048 [Candidatus Wolfebacteria bacterium GW2011_GWD2_47_17]
MNMQVESATKKLLEFFTEHTRFEELPDADIIVVFGHYDQRVAQQAAYLWQMGKARHIIIAGKGGSGIPREYETEADFYAALMIGRGIPKEAILLEKTSTNSLENVQKGMEVWKAAGIDPKTIIACSIPLLLRRSCATLRKQCPNTVVHGSAFKMREDEWFSWDRLMRIVAEVDRLDQYAEKGDIETVEIPPHIRSAVQTVKLYCIA